MKWPSSRNSIRSPGFVAEAAIIGLAITVLVLSTSLASTMRAGAFNDDGVYVVMGKALAEGRGYFSIHLAGSPVQAKFPPGYPLVLSLLWRISGSVDGVHHLVALIHPAIVGLTAAILWWVGRACLAVPRFLLALLVVTPFLFDAAIQYYTIPLSEPWFMLGWACVLALYAVSKKATGGRQLVLCAAAGAMVAATVLMRSQGMVLVPAMLVGLVAARFPWRARLIAIGTMLGPLAWWSFYRSGLMLRGPHSGLPDDVAYGTWFGGINGIAEVLLTSATSNVLSYTNQIGQYFSESRNPGVPAAALLLLVITMASIGTLRRAPVLALSSLGGLVIVVIWPFAQDRLLLSVLPFGGLAAAVWLTPAASRLTERTRRFTAIASGICIALILWRQAEIRSESVAAFSAGRRPPSFSPTYMLLTNSRFIDQASDWIRGNTTPSDRVMIDNHPGVYLYTGRVTTPATPAESRLQTSVFTRPAEYLATRILRDSITWVIVGVPSHGIVTDINTIIRGCPGVLTKDNPKDAKLIFEVHRNEPCLESLIARNETTR